LPWVIEQVLTHLVEMDTPSFSGFSNRINDLKPAIFGNGVEIPIVVEKGDGMLDCHCGDHATDWLADCDALPKSSALFCVFRAGLCSCARNKSTTANAIIERKGHPHVIEKILSVGGNFFGTILAAEAWRQ
jgi:hypothetical protein